MMFCRNVFDDPRFAELLFRYKARNWPEVLRLVRILDKRKALHPALSTRLRELAYEALLGEAADLLYHLQVLLRARGRSLEDTVAVLRERHKAG